MTPDSGVTGQDAGRGFVVSSEVTISPESAGTLELAFRERLHLVEKAPGFLRLEVWRDVTRPGVFQMVSWWDNADSFRRYMRSADHWISHARIPRAPHRPRGTGVRRYVLLPDSLLGRGLVTSAAELCGAPDGGP
jgi:heme-degrading monooxygenase HmoA